MKVIECKQGTEMWFEARKGIPTSSCFDKILTPRTMKPSASQDDYIAELIADQYRQGPWTESEGYRSLAMQHGVYFEPEARNWYCFQNDCEVREVGLCLTDDGRFGCSPDALCGEDGGLELKCPTGKTQVKYLLNGGLPDEYKCQVHGALIVTGRSWWHFCSYCPGLPPLLLRVEPNGFTESLRGSLETFWLRYRQSLEFVRGLGKEKECA